ncbi:MAG: putative cobaltochelatase [Dehalococcoidia bacterium]|nr:putative cobaltochelatase [Dehalococcoidia bacterium]
MTSYGSDVYPFSAIVGQERMKKALVLNAINPRLGGVLIRGQKGTAKSTAVRGLAKLLPDIEVVDNCPYHCDPHNLAELCQECRARLTDGGSLPSHPRKTWVVDLPVSSTEDRVVGTLDIEEAIKHGRKRFEPGILAGANRGILYVDEVNLLADHLVDVLLDAAAMGNNTVEREGVSFAHPARFILVGTMNPEEGELRPQLLDRFALCVEIEGIADVEQRVAVIKRGAAHEADPASFEIDWQAEQERLRAQIIMARQLLPRVNISDDILALIARICIAMNVDGHRADIVIMKTASTLAAFLGRTIVDEDDVREAAELALPHRMKRKPFEDQKMDEDKIEEAIKQYQADLRQKEETCKAKSESDAEADDGDPSEQNGNVEEKVFAVGKSFSVKDLQLPKDRTPRQGSGRRAKSVSTSRSGQYVRTSIPKDGTRDIAFDATLRVAAPFQSERARNGVALEIHPADIRQKVRESKVGCSILFVVDASTSMGALQRMVAVKGAILSLLVDAYQRRDRVGLAAFRGEGTDLLLPLTNSVEMAKNRLEQLPVGGKTPLPHGLSFGYEMLKREQQKNKNTLPLMILISDGRANVSMSGESPAEESRRIAARLPAAGIRTVVVDTGQNYINLGLPREIANLSGGLYFKLEDLESETIISLIHEEPAYDLHCRAFGN